MRIQKNERNITTKSNVKLGWIVLPKKKKKATNDILLTV